MKTRAWMYSAAACAAVLLSTGCGSHHTEQAAATAKPSYGDEFYSESVKVLNRMWDMRKDQIGAISSRAAKTIREGGKVVWDCTAGHSNIYEVEPTLPCLPKGGMISATEFSGQKATIDALGKGDMLITNFINEQTAAARKRGVYVVGVTNSYFRHPSFSDQDNADKKPNYQDLNLEDISDEVLISEVPGQVGLVAMPHTPEMKCGAGVGNFMIALYWMVVADVANLMKNPDAQPLEYATQYHATVMERLDAVMKNQKAVMYETAKIAAEKVGGGAHMWVLSTPKSVYSDAAGASMGLVFTNHFPKNSMKAGDILFVADAADSSNSAMVEEARAAKEKGCYIIAAGPANQTALKEIADAYFDNLSPEGYGLFAIPGHDNKIALAGSLINCIVYGTFSVQMVDEMCQRGWFPKYYMSYNWGGASGGYFDWLGWSVKRVGY